MRPVSATAWSLAISIFGSFGSANAMPFTYDFNLPSWTHFDSNYFGSYALLRVTFENGNGSNASQTYRSADITSLTLAANNGAYSHTWSPSGHRQGMDLSFFSTDSNGVATLYLPVVPGSDTSQPASLWSDYTTGGQSSFQLGVMTKVGGATPISVNTANPWPNFERYEDVVFHHAAVISYDWQGYAPIRVEGRLRTDIPEPISFALFGIGFATLLTRCKHRAQT